MEYNHYDAVISDLGYYAGDKRRTKVFREVVGMAAVESRASGVERGGVMGQHKFNPVAIAAKNGEIPPKKPNQTKRGREAELNKIIWQVLFEKGLAEPFMMAKAIGDIPYNRIESARGRSKTDGDLETELEEFVRWKGGE